VVDIRLSGAGRALAVAAALGSALGAGAAAADPPAVYGARRAEALTFRDWRLGCIGAACAVRTAVRGGDGSEVLALVARGAGVDEAVLEVRTPLPLHLPDGVLVGLGEAPLRRIAWRTCDAQGCVADAPLDADLVAALEREPAAEVTLTLAEGVKVRFPVSLLGFTAARRAAAVSP
jgi:invasion protein IalB